MNKINVYDFCYMFNGCKEIRLHVWTFHSDGKETCEHKTYTDRFDIELFDYKDAEVAQFKSVKKNVIEIIAIRDNRNL